MKEETRIRATSEEVTAWQTENGKDAGREITHVDGIAAYSPFLPDSST